MWNCASMVWSMNYVIPGRGSLQISKQLQYIGVVYLSSKWLHCTMNLKGVIISVNLTKMSATQWQNFKILVSYVPPLRPLHDRHFGNQHLDNWHPRITRIMYESLALMFAKAKHQLDGLGGKINYSQTRGGAVPTDLYRISFHSCQTRNPTWHHGQTPGQSKIIGNSEEKKAGIIVVKIFKTSPKRSSVGLFSASVFCCLEHPKNCIKRYFFISFIFSLDFGYSYSVVTVLREWSVPSHTPPF